MRPKLFPDSILLFLMALPFGHCLFRANLAYPLLKFTEVPSGLQEELKRNGLFAESVGNFVEAKYECGFVTIDFSSYTHGNILNETLQYFETHIGSDHPLPREEILHMYNTAKGHAMDDHITEMKELFGGWTTDLPPISSDHLQFFPLAPIGFGFGIAVGAAVVEGVHFIAAKLFGPADSDVAYWRPEIVTWTNHQIQLATNITLYTSYNFYFQNVFTSARAAIHQKVDEALNSLINEEKIRPELLLNEGGLWSAIGDLMGSAYPGSVLAANRRRIANSLRATVVGKSSTQLLVKTCFPTAQTIDARRIVQVVPFGRFEESGLFTVPRLEGKYALGNNDSIEEMELIDEDKCVGVGDYSLCRNAATVPTCSLRLDRQQGCHFTTMDASKEMAYVRPLARNIVVSTNAKAMVYTDAEDRRTTTLLDNQQFVLTLPFGAHVEVGRTTIRSRMAEATMDMVIEYHNAPYVEPPKKADHFDELSRPGVSLVAINIIFLDVLVAAVVAGLVWSYCFIRQIEGIQARAMAVL